MAAASPANATVESALRHALDLHGSSLIFEPTRLRALLEQRCPHAFHDVASVMKAVDAQVPQALVGTHDGAKLRKLARVLEKKLRDRYGLNRYAAAWTVRTWADALGRTGLALTETSADAASPATEAPPLDRSAAPSLPDREAGIPSPEPQTTTSSMTATASSSADGRPAVAARAPLRRPWLRAVLALGFIAAAGVLLRYVDGSSAADERSAVRHAQARAEASRIDTIAAATAKPAPVATTGDPSTRPPSVAAASTAAARAATPLPVAPSLVEAPEIIDVASNEALIGDGRQRELLITLRTPHAAIENVESRFVSGDALLATRPAVIDVSDRARRDDRVPAGLIGVETTRPVRATFEYVVTTIDGRRSAPFLKELIVAPGPVAPRASGATEAPMPSRSRSANE